MSDDKQRPNFYGNVTIDGQQNAVHMSDSITVHYHINTSSATVPVETLQLILDAASKINADNIVQSTQKNVAWSNISQLDMSHRRGKKQLGIPSRSWLDCLANDNDVVKSLTSDQSMNLDPAAASYLEANRSSRKTPEQMKIIREHIFLAAVIVSWLIHKNLGVLDVINLLSRHGFREAAPSLLIVLLAGLYRYHTASIINRFLDSPSVSIEDAYGFSRRVSIHVFSDYMICQQFLRVHYSTSARLVGWRCAGAGRFDLRLDLQRNIRFREQNWQLLVKCLKSGLKFTDPERLRLPKHFVTSPALTAKFPPIAILSSILQVRNIKHVNFGFIPLIQGSTTSLQLRTQHLANDVKFAHDEITAYLKHQIDTSSIYTEDSRKMSLTVPAFFSLTITLRQVCQIFKFSELLDDDPHGKQLYAALDQVAILLRRMWWVMASTIEDRGCRGDIAHQVGSWKSHGSAIRRTAEECDLRLQFLGQTMLPESLVSNTETSSKDTPS